MSEKIICGDCGGEMEEVVGFSPKVYKCIDCGLELDEKDLEGEIE
jgi:tRNA(Ile2) C34 agmatinyltransferase TiaS